VLTTLGSSDWVGEKFGTQPPNVLALHGWGRSGSDFAGILEGHNALALHLPGFGSTPPPPAAWSPGDYADRVAEAMEGLDPQVVVGHSFGGRIAIRLAARHPHRVSALVLTGVPLTRVKPARRSAPAFALAKRLHRWGLVSEKVMEKNRQKYGSPDYKNARGVMREILVKTVAEDYLEDAARISAPVTLVWGELDVPAPLEAAQKSLDYFPHATLRVVTGAAHLLEGTLEVDVRKAVSDALAS
jgi:pimeloyl-ACP methyl ester carboxylesterase